MILQTFPPLCPFGDETDGIELQMLGTTDCRWNCWHLGGDYYLRVNVYDNGERSYLIGTRTQIVEDFRECWFADDVAVDEAGGDLKKLRKMGLTKIANYVK